MNLASNSRIGPRILLPKAFTCAFSPSKIGLAAAGLSLTWIVNRLLDWVIPGTPSLAPGVTQALPKVNAAALADPGRLFVDCLWALCQPAKVWIKPFPALFQLDSAGLMAHHGLSGLLVLAIWAVIGASIVRMTLVQVTRPHRQGLGPIQALTFAMKRSGSLAAAPLVPLVGVASITAMTAALGLLYRVPGPIGIIGAGLLGFLPYLGGLASAVFLGGLALGWPLMVASVAAEGEDGFDAFSRAFAFATQRPLKYTGYAVIALLLGVPAIIGVSLLTDATSQLAAWGLAITAPDDVLMPLLQPTPGPSDSATAASLHAFWRDGLQIVSFSFVFVFFWTSVSLIYLLLRQDVDGVEWDDIADDGTPESEEIHGTNGEKTHEAVDPMLILRG